MVIYDKDKKILVIPVGVYGVESHGGGEGGCNLTTLTATSNGIYIPTEYDGYSKVEVNVKNRECPELEEEVEELTDKVAELTSRIEEKDIEVERLEGENAELVNKNEELSGEIEEKNTEIERLEGEVTEAYNMGMANQKAKLESVIFTENGIYTKEDGYNMITVDVPSGGDCPELEREVEELTTELNNKTVELAEKESEVITLTETNTALNEANNALSEENTELTAENQTLTDENTRLREEVTTAYDDGIADQKAKLTSTTIRSNGTYTREDGFNEVNVQIPTEDVRILDLIVNLQQGMANNFNYKYSASFLVRSGIELKISSSQDVLIVDYEGNCTRYVGENVRYRTTSSYNMVYVLSNDHTDIGTGYYYANYGCVYLDNITGYDYLPMANKLDMYFTPKDCKIKGGSLMGTEIKFHTKDKPNINTIVYPNNLTLYFPIGTDLEDLKNQYPTVTIIEF